MKDQFLLQDGTYADPGDCSKGKDGLLRHKNGLVVAMSADGEPQTLYKTAEANKAAIAAGSDKPVEDTAAKAEASKVEPLKTSDFKAR